MQVSVFILLLIEFFGQVLSSLVGTSEDDALVDDQLRVYFIDGFHLLFLVQEHVVVGQPDQHQLVHQVDHLGFGHELLLEGLDPDRKSG